MAEITLGFGTSHGSLLITKPEDWVGRAAADRRNKALAYRRKTYNFEELLEERRQDDFAAQCTIEVRRERYDRCQKQLDVLADTLVETAPDVVLIVGDDQHEWFNEDAQPTFAVFCGDTVSNLAVTAAETTKNIKDGRLVDPLGYHPATDVSYPVETDLARHIISRSMHEGFDLTACMKQPKDAHEEGRLANLGHAYAFVYRRILRDKPIPIVPVLVNTFYPPNQPMPKRCYELGRMIGRAIQSWDRKLKVAVCGSGGLTHFVIDEAFDEKLLQAMQSRDEVVLTGEAEEMYRSGTSETKNWLVCAGIVAETSLEMKLLDYVPCYRSEAGTGNAMAFATWR
jgi:hypothetical protein